MLDFTEITQHIEQVSGTNFNFQSAYSLSGGDINSAYCLQGKRKRYFVKLNRADLLPMFEAEYAGLAELTQTQSIRIPQPITCGKTAQHAFIVLEYIEFGPGQTHTIYLLGEQLARLHQPRQAYFGWYRDNTIGSTPQINTANDNWIEFWRTQRLGMQLNFAAQQGYHGKIQHYGAELCANLATFFTGYHPQPSLIHGDLWQGNTAFDQAGQPVIFDPACYYADREAELAMTELFGGFNKNFYAAYNTTWAVDSGYAVRKKLYNLYHILNHLNLFGGGYLHQAERMLEQLLSEIK